MTTEPAAVVASSPIFTGATIVELEPVNTRSPTVVWCLSRAVIIRKDSAGTDVRPGADRDVTEVGKVVRLGALAELGVLGLDEVAEVHTRTEPGAGTHMGERTHETLVADLGAAHHRVLDHHIGAHRRVNDPRIRPDDRTRAHTVAPSSIVPGNSRTSASSSTVAST